MTRHELKAILAQHAVWAFDSGEGARAYLAGAYLAGADLTGAYLAGANLAGAYLAGVNLAGANLTRANLAGAYLAGADLAGADLTRAYLAGVNLAGADLTRAYLAGANLVGADLAGANLPHFQVCPEVGSFLAYKKVASGVVLTLEIPAEAQRTSSLVGRKCRASAAKVLAASDGSTGPWVSRHDSEFVYRLGETVVVPDYDPDIRTECTRGVHFFLTRREAEEY